MSLSSCISKSIQSAVDSAVESFANQIAEKYELNSKELLDIWKVVESGGGGGKVGTSRGKAEKKVSVSTIGDDDSLQPLDAKTLSACNKTELVAHCKQRKLKCSGTKDELISRLTNSGGETTTEKKVEKVEKVESSNTKKTETKASVLSKIVENKIPIRRNQFGNYEHPPTSLVFDKVTKKIIGKQNDNGSVDDLTPEDIDMCNQYSFEYVLPTNLAKKSTLNDVKVEELGDGDIDGDEEEEYVEEEEELNEDELLGDDDEEEEELEEEEEEEEEELEE